MYESSAYKAKPLSRHDLERMATKLREILGISNDSWVDVLGILEHALPVIDDEFYLEVVADDELDAHARAFPDEHLIKMRESVYEGARRGVGRDRFTVVHEIFHYIWHDSKEISFARNPSTVKVYENPEWQADAFAGAFLMPKELIRGKTVDNVVKEFGVSRKAAAYQLKVANKKR